MLQEFQKFVNSVLQERTSTPLYSTFAVSWAVTNWRVIYATLFVNQDNIPKCYHNKLAYIESLLNWLNGLFIPLGFTAAFIFAFPYIANETYKASLRFRRKRIDAKASIIDKDRLLTIEQAAQIRNEAEDRVSRHEKARNSVEEERKLLAAQLQLLRTDFDNYKTNDISDKKAFKVLHAKYGSSEGNWVDATDILRHLMNSNQPKGSFQITNQLAGKDNDPAPGVYKLLLFSVQMNERIITDYGIEGDVIHFDEPGKKVLVEPGSGRNETNNAMKQSQMSFRI